ncbi:MAG: YfaZ family outer membrane protein [Gammaproteobacteria bacterium]|nr:YfaZ family outer membrane protein [Gammaproteobacteria bacterium]
MRFVASLIGITLLCAQVIADELDLSLNNDALRLQYVYKMESSGLNLDTGWLHHSDNGDILHAGVHLVDLASSGRDKLEAGLGGRFVYTNGDHSDQSGFAVPIGGFVRFTPEAINRLSVVGSLYYAPSILAIGDMDEYQEASFRVSYSVIRDADMYVGARYARGDYKKGVADARFDSGMHIGMTLRF